MHENLGSSYAMPLTDVTIRNARPRARDYYLNDADGLRLCVTAAGRKIWRFRRLHNDRQVLRTIGRYPAMSLAEARQRCEEMNISFDRGVDPNEVERQHEETRSNTFELVAREWHGRQQGAWSGIHAQKILQRLEANIFPFFGQLPITEVQPQIILQALRAMEEKGHIDLAHRMHQIVGRIFRYAIATGRAERDNAADLKGALPPVRNTHHASITDPVQVGHLLRAIDGYMGTYIVSCALKLSPLLFTRPGELRHAEWAEIDVNQLEWRIPAHKTKMRTQHIVPLSTQAVAIFESLRPETGSGRYVFPGRTSSRPMSENTVGAALRYLGYSTQSDQSAHGFRSMASTLLNELGWNRDAIERQLGHAERDGVRAAYNYAEYLPERRRMMQAWADYLDQLKAEAGGTNPVGNPATPENNDEADVQSS